MGAEEVAAFFVGMMAASGAFGVLFVQQEQRHARELEEARAGAEAGPPPATRIEEEQPGQDDPTEPEPAVQRGRALRLPEHAHAQQGGELGSAWPVTISDIGHGVRRSRIEGD